MESEISDSDKYVDLTTIWMDKSESYYPSRVLEEKLESIEKKYLELIYEHIELKNINKSLENELKTTKEEKLKSKTLNKKNTAQLPHYRSNIIELKKEIKELTSGNKKLEIDIINHISKSKGVDEQLKVAKSEIFTLTVNNKKLSQEIKDFENRKLKNIKDTKKIKLENEEIKATIKSLKIENFQYKSQIASLNGQLKVKDKTINGLISDNKRKDTNIKQYRFQSKLGKTNVSNETICGVLNEKHYISRIHVLELNIKKLYEENESLKYRHNKEYETVKSDSWYDKKQADKKIKALEKTLEEFKLEIDNKKGTIATQDKELLILRTMLSNEKYTNYLGKKSRIWAEKVRDLKSVIQANKKESIGLKIKIKKLEETITKLKHNNENVERDIKEISIIKKSVVQGINNKPTKSCSMEESLQRQICKLQDKINEEKSKNSNLSNQLKKVTDQKEMDHTFSTNEPKDAQRIIQSLMKLNMDLTLKINALEKYYENYNELKAKENQMKYVMQHEKTNLLTSRKLEFLNPEIKKKRVIYHQLVTESVIESRTKCYESMRAY